MSQTRPQAAHESVSTDESVAAESSLLAEGAALWQTICGVLRETLVLAALEGRLAALSATRMLAVGLAAGLLGVAGLLALITALAIWLARSGIGLELAFVIVGIVNITLGVAAWVWVRHLSRNLMFAATRRQLQSNSESARPKAAQNDAT